ncbi:efflux RND transporter periplasmic adaptor subunit [Pelolinea submarina]|uniref:HlyD family secretion protein n=1 Tax=Pelolinea submarina TaxID=913107 RepID=A0A347ZVX3_9CHLR|nr:efflux RND transporter periplasmic adaptor subunit [Pelolinea submarina]REG07151.1 HlyD family secretion protein [Pelolinea submarina]BBB49454.1 HlyD family secretion protein [Pelolinea submarina]
MVKKDNEELKKKKSPKEVVEKPVKKVQESEKKRKFSLKGIWQWIMGVWHWILAKPIRWIAILALLIIVVFVANNQSRARKTAMDEYQTVKLERSDMVVIVGATGIVEANQTADLEWQTTGRVESVNVAVNDRVKAGDILADLADNTLPQSVILAQADLVDAQKAMEDLINSNTESAESYKALLEAEQDLRDEEDDRDQWNYNDANIDRVNEFRADFIAKEEEYKIYKAAYEAVKNLPADDPKRVKAKQERDDAKLVRDKALRALNYLLGKAYGQQVAEDFADADIAQAKLDDAQRDWDRVKNGANADDISAAEAKVAAAEATVSLGWIEAPFNGTVTQVDPKVGDQISSGTPAFRIDDLSELNVDVQISEVDINKVVVGQEAELTFDAISSKTYTGEVTEVAKVGEDTGSGVDFTVTLRIVDPDEEVRPGMTAAVNIIVTEKKDVLAIPSRAIRTSEGRRIVYVMRGSSLTAVDIEVGAMSDTSVEVVSGDVSEGDLIILNPPASIMDANGQPAFTR